MRVFRIGSDGICKADQRHWREGGVQAACSTSSLESGGQEEAWNCLNKQQLLLGPEAWKMINFINTIVYDVVMTFSVLHVIF